VSKKQQVDLEVEQVGGGDEHGLLDLGLRVGLDQQVHRAVGVIVVHPVKAGDRRVVAGPLGGRELGGGVERAVGDQREQHPLDIGRESPGAQQRAQRAIDPELLPQAVQQPHAAHRPRLDHLELAAERRQQARAVAGDEARDRRRQPPQRVEVELVLAAEVDQHLGARDPADAAVVRQLHVADHRAVLAPPPRRPQVHAHTDTTNAGRHSGNRPLSVCPRLRSPTDADLALQSRIRP
jgi:hypothetical protein